MIKHNNGTKRSNVKIISCWKMFVKYPQDQYTLPWTIFTQDIQWWIFPNYGIYIITHNRSQNIAGCVNLYILVPVSYFSLLENITQQLWYYSHSHCFIAKVLSDLSVNCSYVGLIHIYIDNDHSLVFIAMAKTTKSGISRQTRED